MAILVGVGKVDVVLVGLVIAVLLDRLLLDLYAMLENLHVQMKMRTYCWDLGPLATATRGASNRSCWLVLGGIEATSRGGRWLRGAVVDSLEATAIDRAASGARVGPASGTAGWSDAGWSGTSGACQRDASAAGVARGVGPWKGGAACVARGGRKAVLLLRISYRVSTREA